MKYFRVWIKYFVDSGSITNLDCKRKYLQKVIAIGHELLKDCPKI